MIKIEGKSSIVKDYNIEERNKKFERENEDDPLAKSRYDICKQCEHLTKLKFCDECYCFMPVKVRIKGVECPLKKW